MFMPSNKAAIAALFGAFALTGCTTPGPTVYEGLASAHQLKPNLTDEGGREPYRFQGDANFQQYNKIIVDPITIYAGADAQFGKFPPGDKLNLATYMQSKFSEKLKTRFVIVANPGPATLRLHLTLTGAKANTPVLGTLSHLDIAGGVYNSVQSVRGGEGSMMGSVSYAVEVYDASTQRLLLAYITKQYPNAMNVGASVGSMTASMIGVEKGADDLLLKLR